MVFLGLRWPAISLNHSGLAMLLCSVNQKFQRELRLVGYALCTGSAVLYAVIHTANDLMYLEIFSSYSSWAPLL